MAINIGGPKAIASLYFILLKQRKNTFVTMFATIISQIGV